MLFGRKPSFCEIFLILQSLEELIVALLRLSESDVGIADTLHHLGIGLLLCFLIRSDVGLFRKRCETLRDRRLLFCFFSSVVQLVDTLLKPTPLIGQLCDLRFKLANLGALCLEQFGINIRRSCRLLGVGVVRDQSIESGICVLVTIDDLLPADLDQVLLGSISHPFVRNDGLHEDGLRFASGFASCLVRFPSGVLGVVGDSGLSHRRVALRLVRGGLLRSAVVGLRLARELLDVANIGQFGGGGVHDFLHGFEGLLHNFVLLLD